MLFGELHNCVYRYRDITDNKIKYVGIVNEGILPTRHKQHRKEEWYKSGCFVCEYIQMNNKSETEAMESHLISYYHSDEYYNKSKTGWGINSMLPIPDESEWKVVPDDTIDYIISEQISTLRFQKEKEYITEVQFNNRMDDLNSIIHALKIERFITSEGRE